MFSLASNTWIHAQWKIFTQFRKSRKFPMTFLKPSSPSHIPDSSLEIKLGLVRCVSSKTCFQTYVCVCVSVRVRVCVCVWLKRWAWEEGWCQTKLGSTTPSADTGLWWRKCRVYCRYQARSSGALVLKSTPTPCWVSGRWACLLAVLGLRCWEGFPLVAVGGGCSLFWLTGSRAQAR